MRCLLWVRMATTRPWPASSAVEGFRFNQFAPQRYRAFTARSAWLVCGTPRFSDMCECVHTHAPSTLLNTIVARPGRSNVVPSS